MKEDWRTDHKTAMLDFLAFINNQSNDFILKGGTALMACYGLDRFSEDIDLDGKNSDIEKIVSAFCDKQGFTYRTAKDTNTVKRFMINYGNTSKPLKVEVSYRRRSIDPNEVSTIQGISVYKLEPLCIMKSNAYASRDRIRDLYDLTFICNNYWDELSSPTQAIVRATVEHKGIEQFDYLAETQQDELINTDKLAADFLKMYDRLDLLADTEPQERLEDRIVTNANYEQKTSLTPQEQAPLADELQNSTVDRFGGNPDYYRFFYAGLGGQDSAAQAFQQETGWFRIWGSDSQGFNGDMWLVYRDVEDLPRRFRDYARSQTSEPITVQEQHPAQDNALRNDIATQQPSDTTTHPAQQTPPTDDKKRELYGMIKEAAENYSAAPEQLAELFKFGSRFYNYSVNNTMLILRQNPNAQYVQSFKAWKDMEGVACSVKRGETGLKILVPAKCTYLKINNELVPLREATKEQAAAHKRGDIESVEKLRFKVGTVFDISQTTFPKERYPELYTMGYPSESHKAVIQGLTDFSKEKLNCPVITTDLQSIALRGDYSPGKNEIRLNALMEDTEKLSTIAHELGHAMVHNNPKSNTSTAQKEFEADAMCIMIQSHCGVEVTDSRKRHLSDNYNTLLAEIKAQPEMEQKALAQTQQIFSSVFDNYKKNIGDIQQCIQKYIPDAPAQTQKQAQAVNLSL